VTQAQARLRTLLGPGDLIDALYLGWFDRADRRATLACAVKTAAVLDRELKLRRLGNGAMTDADFRAALAWLDAALERACEPSARPDYRPQRSRLDADALTRLLTADPLPGPPASLFGVIDRATATRADERWGDFDLLACMGFHIVGCSRVEARTPQNWRTLLRRAESLGLIVTTQGPLPEEWTIADSSAGRVTMSARSLPLAEMFGADLAGACEQTGELRGVCDPPGGESWGERFARRTLYRAATGCRGAVVVGWRPPKAESPATDAAALAALAVWVDALDGQRLGLLDGWRDLRDGSSCPYASLLTTPAVVEAVAQAALDVGYFADEVAQLEPACSDELVIRPDCLDPADPNRFAAPYATLFDKLLDGQVRVSFTPAAELSSGRIIDAGMADALVRGYEAGKFGGQRAVVAREADGSTASNLLVYHGPGGRMALANLAPAARRVRITVSSSEPVPALRDLLTGQVFSDPGGGVDLAGLQVRLFVPATSAAHPPDSRQSE